MGLKNLLLTAQPPIAKAQLAPALRGHVARTGIPFTLAMIDGITRAL